MTPKERADMTEPLIAVDNLRGAIISHAQLLDLAPLLAEQLGLEVRPD